MFPVQLAKENNIYTTPMFSHKITITSNNFVQNNIRKKSATKLCHLKFLRLSFSSLDSYMLL